MSYNFETIQKSQYGKVGYLGLYVGKKQVGFTDSFKKKLSGMSNAEYVEVLVDIKEQAVLIIPREKPTPNSYAWKNSSAIGAPVFKKLAIGRYVFKEQTDLGLVCQFAEKNEKWQKV